MAEISTLNGYKIKDKKAIRFYDSIQSMKSDTTLKSGMHLRTKGYYNAEDGGHAEYIIVSDNTLVDDGALIHDLANGLKAKLLYNDKINALQIGCKTDGTDNSTILNNFFSKGNETGLYFPEGNYSVESEIDTIGSVEMDPNAWLVANDDIDCVVHINKNLVIPTGSFANVYPKNLDFKINVDCNKLANTGIRTDKIHWCKLVLTVKNPLVYGVHTRYDTTKGHAENTFDIQTMYDTNDGTNTATGLYIGGSDDIYNNIVAINTKYCCEVHGSDNSINTIHGWLVNSDLWNGSVLLKISNNKNHISNLIVDTYETGIAFTSDFNLSTGVFSYIIDFMYGMINDTFIPSTLRSSYKLWDFTGLTGTAKNNSSLLINSYIGNSQDTSKISLGANGLCPFNTRLIYGDDYTSPKWLYNIDLCPEGTFGFLGDTNVSGKPTSLTAGNWILRTSVGSYGKLQEFMQVGLNRSTGATTFNTSTIQPTGNNVTFYKRVFSKFGIGNNPWGQFTSYYVQEPTTVTE